MKLNKIYNEDCLEGVRKLPDDSVDLIVTSPPYDDLRTYNGYTFDFENIAKELYRIVKKVELLFGWFQIRQLKVQKQERHSNKRYFLKKLA